MHEDIERVLEEYYRRDLHYESGRILGSMYTKPPDIVLNYFFKFYQANLGNPGLYPGTVAMEREVLRFLLRLTSGEENYPGHVLSGGTEANITALWAAREMGYRRILTTEDAHFSILKASNLLSMPVEYVPMRDYVMDVKALSDIIQDDDVVVATAGITSTGLIDPVEEIGRVCSEHRCFLHVDAAFGGFVIPFLPDRVKFGFDVPAVQSVTIDPHKMGMAPYPAGGLVARENLFEGIAVDAPYLMRGKSDTLLGTRQSGSVAAAYAAILHFGMSGYREVVRECMERTEYLMRILREEGFEILTPPRLNILNIVVKDAEKVKKSLYDIGWAVSTNPRYNSLRIVVMPHVTEEIIEKFVGDLKKII